MNAPDRIALVLLASLSFVPSPVVAQPPGASCTVVRGGEDAMGTLSHPRWYDASGALLGGEWSITYTGRGTERVEYDDHGRVRTVVARHDDAEGEACYDGAAYRAEASYDAAGRLIRVETYASSEHPPEAETQYGYDALDRLVSIRSRGRESVDTQLVYENGRLTRTEGVIHDAYGSTITTRATLTWEGDRLVSHREEWSASGRTEVLLSRFEYDSLGRLIAFVPSAIRGHGLVVEYDAAGRAHHVAESREPDPRAMTFTYDARGRVRRVEREDHAASSSYRYSGACPPVPVPDLPDLDPLALLRLVACIPTQTGGCISPDGRRRVMRR